MIYIEQNQKLKDDPKFHVAVPTGDYNESDLIECYFEGENPNVPTHMFQAQYIALGKVAYQQSEELTEEQVLALLANRPAEEVINNRKMIDGKPPASKYLGQVVKRDGKLAKRQLRDEIQVEEKPKEKIKEEKIVEEEVVEDDTDNTTTQTNNSTSTQSTIATTTSSDTSTSTPNQNNTANVSDAFDSFASSTPSISDVSTSTPSTSASSTDVVDVSTTTPTFDLGNDTTVIPATDISTSSPVINEIFDEVIPQVIDEVTASSTGAKIKKIIATARKLKK